MWQRKLISLFTSILAALTTWTTIHAETWPRKETTPPATPGDFVPPASKEK